VSALRSPAGRERAPDRGGALRLASFVVAAVGLAVAGYLTVVHYDGGSPVCAIAHGCATVQQSDYASLAGVPVALLGVLGYAAILVGLLIDTEPARLATAFVALVGAGCSAWLTYVEVFTLEAICSWCVASAVCMTILAALSAARALGDGAPP
jgi:uncharacterized membrane protein